MPILSILILTTSKRIKSLLPVLLNKLEKQIGNKDIEVLALYDNKKRSVGEKRNALVEIANGRHLCFIDDDDDIANNYIYEIINAIENNPFAECIVFDQLVTIDGKTSQHWKYNRQYYKDKDEFYHYGRAAHTHVWLSHKAKMHKFPNKNYEEDVSWIESMSHDGESIIKIDKILYFYNFNSLISETRE